jgi:hypothetical protein
MHREFQTQNQVPQGFRHWRSLGDGFLVSLVVVGPTFLFEELWRGKPMIDQGGFGWVVPAVIMMIGFFVGGRVTGRNRGTRSGAFLQGLLVSGLTLGLIFVADMIRRIVLTEGLSWGVMLIWFGSALGALLIAGLGGISGRRGAVVAQRRHQMDRFH